MPAKRGKAWKMERASVNVAGQDRPRSNKYSGGDAASRPEPGTRSRIWVGGYVRANGTKVGGHYRAAPGHEKGG